MNKPDQTSPDKAATASVEASHAELSNTLRGLARQLVGDAARADDLVQEAWVAALDRRPESVRDLAAWLRKVVFNLAGRSHRRRLRQRDVEVLAAATEAVESEERLIEQASTYRMLRSATDDLSEPQRSVVIARFFDGQSVESIVTDTGRSNTTVRRQINRGLDDLRAALDRRHRGHRSAWSAILATVVNRGEGRPVDPVGDGAELATAGTGALNGGLLAAGIAVSVPVAIWLGVRLLDDPSAETPRISGEPIAMAAGEQDMAEPLGSIRQALDGVSAQGDAAAENPGALPPDDTQLVAPARALDVRVYTEDGTPVPRPEVQVWSHRTNDVVLGDEGGQARLEYPADRFLSGTGAATEDLRFNVRARAPGQAWSLLHMLRIPEGGRKVELFTRGAAFEIQGVVLDVDGNPVAGATVGLDEGDRVAASDTQDGARTTTFTVPVTTDLAGHFRWESLPRKPHRIRVNAGGFAPLEQLVDGRGANLDLEGRVEVRFVLLPGRRLTGRVYLDDGHPAVGARVWLSDGMAAERGEKTPQAICDGQGLYTLHGIGPGERFIFACLPRRPELFARVLLDVPEEGDSLSWDAKLERTEGLRVRVEDASGDPIEGAVVLLNRKWGPMWAQVLHTDREGRAHFLHTADGQLDALVSRAIGDPRLSQFQCELGIENVFRLEARSIGASLRGTLLDEFGLLQPDSVVVGASRGELFVAPLDVRSGAFAAASLEPGSYELVLVVGELGAAPLGCFDIEEGQALEVAPMPIPLPRVVELNWHGVRPSAEQPWVLSALFRTSSDGRTLLALNEPAPQLELLPGAYRLAPFDDDADDGILFEIPIDGAGPVPAVDIR